jgi:replicative DNA helicase
MVFVDYLQLMTTGMEGRGNREQEISNISRSLKSLAKELNIPVLALSQLSRAVETRGGSKKPILSDLRESGAIEQDADLVLFIYRAEYYNLDHLDDGSPSSGIAEIFVAKHRNGPLRDVKLRFLSNYARFMEYESDKIGYNESTNSNGERIRTFQSRMNEEKSEEPPF